MSNPTLKSQLPAAIIFLQLPLSPYSKKLSDEVINNYQNDWQILKTILSKGFYDDQALEELITQVKTAKDYPVHILIDSDLLNNPYYSLMWSVFGVLSIAKLTTVISYERYYNEIISTTHNIPPNRFLSEAAHYLEHINISRYPKIVKTIKE